jgi:tRNA-2-methylthio-N6-dimethylallyladenosine synthase
MSKRVFLETFGCQMNVLDSELVRDDLVRRGYAFVGKPEDADVVLYNTCSVREQSEHKVLSRLGVVAKRKQAGEKVVVGMLGCMAERAGALRGVDVVVGPSELDRLGDLLADGGGVALSGHAARRSSTLDAAMDRLEALDRGRSADVDQTAQAYVRITRGCDKFCSFCVVPRTRGPEVHRPPQSIVDEVKRLVDAGVVEVTLLGQTINHYVHEDTSFARLLARVHDEVPGLRRLRFLTSYPRDFTDEALDVMASRERICRFLHVPAQSGSDRLLKLMNRGYTADEYRRLIDRARARMPDVSIVGDMIVGYPTETEEDFAASLRLLDDVQYKTVYVFKYSPRPGTVAEKRDADDVPDAVKRDRNQRMLQHQQRISQSLHAAMVGTVKRVLVEGDAKIDPDHLAGRDAPRDDGSGGLVRIGSKKRTDARARLTSRTTGDHIVAFDGPASLIGSLVDVRVTRATALSLQGELA